MVSMPADSAPGGRSPVRARVLVADDITLTTLQRQTLSQGG
jgi:hypothetical protein